jgi:hypothetical protein
VVGFDSWPKVETSVRWPPWASTNSSDWTNMPPEPQQSSLDAA